MLFVKSLKRASVNNHSNEIVCIKNNFHNLFSFKLIGLLWFINIINQKPFLWCFYFLNKWIWVMKIERNKQDQGKADFYL